jgi:hypothetical protein
MSVSITWSECHTLSDKVFQEIFFFIVIRMRKKIMDWTVRITLLPIQQRMEPGERLKSAMLAGLRP